MELSKSLIHMNNLKGQIVTQITLDDDFNVPDAKADIDKYITRDAMVHIESAKASEGRVNVRGKMDFKILYEGGNEKKFIHSIENSIPFDEIINGDKIGNHDVVHVKCDIDDLNIGIINTRKISVRAVLTFTISTEEMCDMESVEEIVEDPAVHYLRRTEPMLQIVVNKKDTYRIREDIELPSNKPNISEILWSTVTLNNISTKLYPEKVGVSGELVLFLLYEDEEEDTPVQYLESAVPFDGGIDVAGCDEDMIGDIEASISSINVNLKPDYDGEQRMIELEVVLELGMRVYREDELPILCDVYSLKDQLKPSYQEISYSRLIMKNLSKCKINDKLKLNKDSGHVMQLLSAQGTANIEDIYVEQKGIRVEGIVKIKIMYVSSDDKMPFNIADEVVPFSHLIEAEGVTEQSMSFIRPSLEQISAVMSGNNEIEVKCSVVLDALIMENCTSRFITDVESMPFDMERLQNIPSMAGYVVKNGDTLWQIAKKYCTTIDSIMKINELKNETIHKGDMLVIIKETP